MNDDAEQLLRVFVSQVERTLDNAAGLLERAQAGALSATEAKRAGDSMRALAAQARQIRPMLPPPVM